MKFFSKISNVFRKFFKSPIFKFLFKRINWMLLILTLLLFLFKSYLSCLPLSFNETHTLNESSQSKTKFVLNEFGSTALSLVPPPLDSSFHFGLCRPSKRYEVEFTRYVISLSLPLSTGIAHRRPQIAN